MKVLLPTEYYPPFAMGGAEISAKMLAEGLADLGVEVHVLTPKYDSSAREYSEENGVVIQRFESPRKIFFKGKRVSEEAYIRRRALYYLLISRYIRFSAREFCKKITKLHPKEKFDLIHAQNVESVFGLNLAEVDSPKIAHLRGLQYFCIDGSKWRGDGDCKVCSIRGIEDCLKTNKFFATLIQHELEWRRDHIEDFNHYITVSKYIAQEAEKEGFPSEKLSVIHNPIDESQVSNLTKEEARKKLRWNFENIVIYVGGLTEAKGVKLLLKIAHKAPMIDFVVVGRGPLENWLREAQKSLNNLHYMGQFQLEEIKHCYRAADILFVPSIWQEPYPRVIIEGQTNEACVVAFATGGIPEAIEQGKTGFLIPKEDVDGAINIFHQLLNNKSLAKAIGKQASKKVRRENSKKEFTKKILNIYRFVM